MGPNRVPNGGCGWVIVLVSFIVNFLLDGIAYSCGIYFPVFSNEFQESDSKTALIASLANGCYLAISPVAGAVTKKFGCRKVAICGSIWAAVSLGAASLSPSIDVVIATFGISFGLAFGFLYLPSIVIVNQWFDSRRGVAVGVTTAGTALGMTLMPYLCQTLVDLWGWRNSLRILGGTLMLLVPLVFLYRPATSNQVSSGPGSNSSNGGRTSCSNMMNFLGIGIFKDWRFVLLCAVTLVASLGYWSPFIYIKKFLISKGVSDDHAVLIVMLFGFANLIGRPLAGLLMYLKVADSVLVLNSSIVIGGLLTVLFPFLESAWIYPVYTTLFGFAAAFHICSKSLSVVDLIGIDNLENGFGFILLFMGIGCTVGSPILGLFYNESEDSYTMVFVLAGLLMIFGGLIGLPLKFRNSLRTEADARLMQNPTSASEVTEEDV